MKRFKRDERLISTVDGEMIAKTHISKTENSEDAPYAERITTLLNAADGQGNHQAAKNLKHGYAMYKWLQWTVKMLLSSGMHKEECKQILELMAEMTKLGDEEI